MIKAFNLSERLANDINECASVTKHLVWKIGAEKNIDLGEQVIDFLKAKGIYQENLNLMIRENLNEGEFAEIKKNCSSIIKRCDSALSAASYLARVANNQETQEIDPRIVKLFPKLKAIEEKINSGEFKQLEDTKLTSYMERLDSFDTERRPWLNDATVNSVNEAKALAKGLMLKFERTAIKNTVEKMFNEIEGIELGNNGAPFDSLKKMIACISSNKTGEEFDKTTLELSKLDGLFAMDGEGEKKNVLNRIYDHLYHILENKKISMSGVKKSDFDFGEKVFKSSESSIQIAKLRAVRRVAIELLLSDLKEAIESSSGRCVFGALIALEGMENQLKDVLGEKNVAHDLFGAHYKYCKENDPNKYGCDAPEWGTEFGRVAAVLGDNKILSNEARLAIVQKEMNSHKDKWATEDRITN